MKIVVEYICTVHILSHCFLFRIIRFFFSSWFVHCASCTGGLSDTVYNNNELVNETSTIPVLLSVRGKGLDVCYDRNYNSGKFVKLHFYNLAF